MPVPPRLRPPGAAEDGGAPDRGRTLTAQPHNTGMWLGLVVMVLLALAVLFALPSLVDDAGEISAEAPAPPAPHGPAVAASVAQPLPESRPSGSGVTAPADDDRPSTGGAARALAQGTLQALLKVRARLEADGAERWADEDWQALLSMVEDGDVAFEQGRFKDANRHWNEAMQAMEDLTAERDSWLRRHLQAGASALDAGDAAAAADAFERALAAQADHPDALSGLRRAKVLDSVLAATRSGEESERRGELEKAIGHYREAVQLDPDHQESAEAVARLEAALRDRDFSAAMSRALASMERGDSAAARGALDEAARLKPQDPALLDARRRLTDQGRADALGRLQARGRIAAIKEDWPAAARAYEKALGLEPGAGFALTGLAKARDRLKLHEQLDHYLERPERVFGREPLANAERVLLAAGEDVGGEPGLAKKLAALRALTEQAKQPMRVLVRSDGETEVTVYHVARLGRFETHTLELRPGSYTAVGTREGYRDVRRVIKLLPGQPVPPVYLACTETI
ncbi:MAG: tetratricopeptide repeat protein [Gammaproteobacteria bacterium]